MASVRAALVLLPPFSVVLVMAARWLCRVMARKLSALARSQLACLPSSFVEDIKQGSDELPVALHSRRATRRGRCVVGEEEEQLEEQCVFCLSGIEEGSEVRELRCRHLFHRACLDRWVRARPVSATCPLCRGRLLASPWEAMGYYDYDELEEEEAAVEEDSDMMLLMACVHSSRTWLWPS